MNNIFDAYSDYAGLLREASIESKRQAARARFPHFLSVEDCANHAVLKALEDFTTKYDSSRSSVKTFLFNRIKFEVSSFIRAAFEKADDRGEVKRLEELPSVRLTTKVDTDVDNMFFEESTTDNLIKDEFTNRLQIAVKLLSPLEKAILLELLDITPKIVKRSYGLPIYKYETIANKVLSDLYKVYLGEQ